MQEYSKSDYKLRQYSRGLARAMSLKNTRIVLWNISMLSGTQYVDWELDAVCCNKWTTIKLSCVFLLFPLHFTLLYVVLTYEGELLGECVKKQFNQEN